MRRIFFATTEHLRNLLHKVHSFSLIPLYYQRRISWSPPPPLFFPTTSKNQCYYQLPNPQINKLKFYNSAIKQNTNLFLVVKMVDSNGISLNNRKCEGSETRDKGSVR